MLISETDIRTSLPLWEVDTQKQVIARTFVFADFIQAFEFMTQCAQYANEIDHHPDWSNSWRTRNHNQSLRRSGFGLRLSWLSLVESSE